MYRSYSEEAAAYFLRCEKNQTKLQKNGYFDLTVLGLYGMINLALDGNALVQDKREWWNWQTR